MLRTYTPKNGIKVATYAMPSVKSLHLGMSIKGGSIVESAKDSGLAHYMEHMMVQGIPSFPTAELLSNYIESLAGRYNASTSLLSVHFSISLPFSHLEDALKIASEVFFKPIFPLEAMEKERQAVLNELKQHQDSRWYKFNQYFRKTRYVPGSLIQRETIGKEEIIRSLTREDLIKYWQKYFVPENMYLFIGGNFSEKQLQELLLKYMEEKSSSKKFKGFPQVSRLDLNESQVNIREDKDLQVNYLTFSNPSIKFDESISLLIKEGLAVSMLGGIRSSRLFRLLRYQKGYVYGVSANELRLPGVGLSLIESEVAPEHLDEVIYLVAETLKDFINNGPTEDELRFSKHFFTNQWLMAFDSPSTIADWVEGGLLWRDKILLPEDFIEIIKNLTANDLKKIMNEYWSMDKLQITIQGPIEDIQQNKEKYNKYIRDLQL